MMKIKVLNAETLGKINEINLDLVTNGNREYVVGRSSKSGLILDSNDVSRQHGKFYLLDGNYYYSDLASINGSLVNNQLVECDRSYLLKPGDIVRIGEFLLVLEEEAEEPEIAATVYNANIDWRTALNINLPEVANQGTEDANTSLQSNTEILSTSDDKLILDLTVIQEMKNEESEQQQTPEVDNQLNFDDEHNSELNKIQAEQTIVQALETEDEPSEQHNFEIYTSSDNNRFSEISKISDVETINEQTVDEKMLEEEEVINDSGNVQAYSEDIEAITSDRSEAIAPISEQFDKLSDLETQTTELFEDVEEPEEEPDILVQTPEATSKAFEIISKKYIALMAHDSKKSELVDFVAQHQQFLSKCLTIATPAISETLFQETGLVISQQTPSVPVGGYQGVASLVGTGEALAVILLKDFLVPQPNQANEDALLRLCNVNQILVATNVSTAEAIVHYIKNMVTSL
ncbi:MULTISPECIES: methylglyoxal synthase [Nostoc]|uniref:Methylglyoxal synthase n=1 Tax=Nostoc paludosum FACHB-159 TaxID=2692908 RepID=A0ABR8KJM3_9NOSO|nr:MULTISPECIES: methylglyoxal synthase [Nostoc]MBD2683466.1 methylglyoxal synthase [Nostoc sp. FACHB-857]MBD2739789.1 methylglyoxal synthase [Nostoc paludosum FACHB-159]